MTPITLHSAPARDTVSLVCTIVALLSTVGLLLVGYELQAGVHRDLAAVEQEARHLGRELDAVTARRRAATLAEAQILAQLAQAQGRAASVPDLVDAAASQPDGVVVHSDVALGTVWIDRGSRQGLEPKTRFVAYRLVGGRRQVIGRIEVAEVEADLAMCRVLEADRADPIVKGDLLQREVAR